MKIIFDSEKQKDRFFEMIAHSDWCPESTPHFGLHNSYDSGVDCIWDTDDYDKCKACWENSGIDVEVVEKSPKPDDNSILIGQHVNIIAGDGDGYLDNCVYAGEDSFDYFVVIDVGGLIQLMFFGKNVWTLKKIEGFTNINSFLNSQQKYIQSLYGQEDKRSLGGK